jgi:hypothetical protein
VIELFRRKVPVGEGYPVAFGGVAEKFDGAHRIREDVDGYPTAELIVSNDVGKGPEVPDEYIGLMSERTLAVVPVVDGAALSENSVESLSDPPRRVAGSRGRTVGAEVVGPVGETGVNGAQRNTTSVSEDKRTWPNYATLG